MPELVLNTEIVVWLSLIGFAAGLLDSIVGGGGLIATPAMLNLFPSWSILSIVSTNRASSIFGTSVAAWNYSRTVPLERRVLLPACGGAFVASFLGVHWAQLISTEHLKWFVLAAIVILAIYTALQRELGTNDQRRFSGRKEGIAAFVVGSGCGFYNGLIGPGTGTLLVLGFVSLLGMSFLKSSAVSKPANVAGDLSSFAILATHGYVAWMAVLPLVVFNMLGSFTGSRLAILKGSRFIRRVFLVIVFLLLVRLIWQFATE